MEGRKGMGVPGLQERWTGNEAEGQPDLCLEGLDRPRPEEGEGGRSGWSLRTGAGGGELRPRALQKPLQQMQGTSLHREDPGLHLDLPRTSGLDVQASR